MEMRDLLTEVLEKARTIAESDQVKDTLARVKDAGTQGLEKAKEAVQASGIPEVYEKGISRARSFGSATRQTLELNRDHTELDRVFAEIGKLYYEQKRESPEGFFAPLFEQVEKLRETIGVKEAELENYRAQFAPGAENTADVRDEGEEKLDSDIAEFEAIVNRTETDGKQ